MIPHGAAELLALAESCCCSNPRVVNGWLVDDWSLTDEDLERLTALYRAVLLGDVSIATSKVTEYLDLAGVKLEALLIDEAGANDRVTRADAVELAGAASLLAADNWPPDTLRMPNVPALSRAKSDSGHDAMAVQLTADEREALADGELLYVASIKHTIAPAIGDVRLKLVRSVGSEEMSTAAMARNLRPLAAWLKERGISQAQVERLYLFLEDWPNFEHARIHAVAGIDANRADEFEKQLKNLPEVEPGTYRLRVLLIPDLSTLHERLA